MGSFNYDNTKMVFTDEFIADESQIRSVLDYAVEIRKLPESKQNYVAITGNYSVAGFELTLRRKVSHYIITCYLPSGDPLTLLETGGCSKTLKMAPKWPQISWLILFLYDLSEKQKKKFVFSQWFWVFRRGWWQTPPHHLTYIFNPTTNGDMSNKILETINKDRHVWFLG